MAWICEESSVSSTSNVSPGPLWPRFVRETIVGRSVGQHMNIKCVDGFLHIVSHVMCMGGVCILLMG